MTEFFKAKTKSGQVRLVRLIPDEIPDNPLDISDPIKDSRPLFILTNHRHYNLGDDGALDIAWKLLRKEPKFDNDWFQEDLDVLEQWNGTTEGWDKVEFRQRPGIGPDGSGHMRVEILSKLDQERWVDVTDNIIDWHYDGDDLAPDSDALAFRWNVEPNEDYLEEDIEGLFLAAEHCGAYCLPVFMYDHSGVSLSICNNTWPYNCEWDSGTLGFIMWTSEQIKAHFPGGDPGEAAIMSALHSYFFEYKQYVEGDVWVLEEYDPCGFDFCAPAGEAWLKDNLSSREHLSSYCGLFGYEYASDPETIKDIFHLVDVKAL